MNLGLITQPSDFVGQTATSTKSQRSLKTMMVLERLLDLQHRKRWLYSVPKRNNIHSFPFPPDLVKKYLNRFILSDKAAAADVLQPMLHY